MPTIELKKIKFKRLSDESKIEEGIIISPSHIIIDHNGEQVIMCPWLIEDMSDQFDLEIELK